MRTVEVRSSPVRTGGRNLLFSIVNDITESNNAGAALRSMMDNLPFSIWLKDVEGRYLAMNKHFSDYLRLEDSHEADGKTDLELQPNELAERYRADDSEVMASRQKKHVEEPSFDGKRVHWVETTKTPIIDAQGNVLGTVGTSRDITERKNTEIELRIAGAAFDASQDGIVITDPQGIVLRVNRAYIESTGFSEAEMLGQVHGILRPDFLSPDVHAAMWKALHQNGSWQGETLDYRQNGEEYPQWVRISAVCDADGTITRLLAAHTDITERKAAEESIRKLAFYDSLTSIPNRRLLMDRLHQALTSSIRNRREGALLFIDIDNFKDVNDTLGHSTGDILLQEFSLRLSACVRESDTAARLGGDEFIVLLLDLSEHADDAAAHAVSVGRKLLADLSGLYPATGQEIRITLSIGITMFGHVRESVDDILKQADIAMYQAKAAGRNSLRFFDPALQTRLDERAALESELRRACKQGEFVLFFQPQVRDGQILGAEALIRWRHPQRAMVMPSQFIPLAEETGLILPIGHWVLQTACSQLRAWAGSPETAHLTMAVNVSVRQFHQADFFDQLLAILQSTGAAPEKLELELTESMLLDITPETIDKMDELRKLGVNFALDDFGTGYSSLAYLKRLPISQIKIDQSFIRGVLTDFSDAIIARTIIALGQSMRLSVIAEGVETQEQLEFLGKHGCHFYQGYLFSPPVSLEDFESLLYGKTVSQDGGPKACRDRGNPP